jgi:hypothetical protein
MLLRLALIAASLLAGCVTDAPDKPGISIGPGAELRVGERVSGNFKIGAIVFPLVPGDWILAAVSSIRGGGDQTGQGRFEGAILIEERSGKLSRPRGR